MIDSPTTDAGPEWRRLRFPVLLEADGAAMYVDGMARGPFAICPEDLEANGGGGRLLPVGITHLATGSIVAECQNGSQAMRVVDALIEWWPILRDPVDVEKLAERIDELRAFIYLAGGRPLLDAE